MASNNSPFSALNKMLFSTTPVEKKDQKKIKPSRPSKNIKQRPAKQTVPSINQPGRPAELTASVNQTSQSIDPTEQANQVDQSTQVTKQEGQSTARLMGTVVKRPLAFYIPLAINEKIDEAVLYYQRNYNQKIDRSAVVSAILGDRKIWRKKPWINWPKA